MRLLQILFVFPSTGPLLLMTLRMLDDLWKFLMLASIIVVAFACSFFVLLTAEALPGQEPSIGTMLGLLAEGAMNAEPVHLLEHPATTYKAAVWGLMAAFGIIVVLLLLNLLIARFAKTFDMVYENLDANFNVVFARVVIEGRTKTLVPPPANLVRRVILFTYATAGRLNERWRIVSRARGCWRRVRRCGNSCRWGGERGHHALEEENDSSSDDASDVDSEDRQQGEDWRAGGTVNWLMVYKMNQYLEKAISAKVFPEGVEDYVRKHRNDIAEEYHWRVGLTKQVDNVLFGLTKQIGEVRKQMEPQQQRKVVALRRGGDADEGGAAHRRTATAGFGGGRCGSGRLTVAGGGLGTPLIERMRSDSGSPRPPHGVDVGKLSLRMEKLEASVAEVSDGLRSMLQAAERQDTRSRELEHTVRSIADSLSAPGVCASPPGEQGAGGAGEPSSARSALRSVAGSVAGSISSGSPRRVLRASRGGSPASAQPPRGSGLAQSISGEDQCYI